MALKIGSEVVIEKNLGHLNDRGRDQYYHGDYIDEIPLKSKGKIVDILDDEIVVKVDHQDEEYAFHPKEIQELKHHQSGLSLNLPETYVFKLASQSPIFIINDRVYTVNGTTTQEKDFYQSLENQHHRRLSITASATLASLEKLAQEHDAKKIDKIQKEFLKEMLEERLEERLPNDNYKLITFIVTEVFPYFRAKGNGERISSLLGVQTTAVPTKEGQQRKGIDKKKDAFLKKMTAKIESETFSKHSKKQEKLDELLEASCNWDLLDYSKDYNPQSLLGGVLQGRNVAVVDNTVYNLIETPHLNHKRALNLEGVNFSLVSPKPLGELKARYEFELSKKIRIGALQRKSAHDQEIQERSESHHEVLSLLKKKQYSEGDFGFMREDEDSYIIYLEVPKHAINVPSDYFISHGDYDDDYDEEDTPKKRKQKDSYLWFDKTRIGVSILREDEELIMEDDGPFFLDSGYEHPFANGGGICLGNYNFNQLSSLKKGEAVAKLLKDARRTLLSGFEDIENLTPATPFGELEHRRITLSELKRRNIPITNIVAKRAKK